MVVAAAAPRTTELQLELRQRVVAMVLSTPDWTWQATRHTWVGPALQVPVAEVRKELDHGVRRRLRAQDGVVRAAASGLAALARRTLKATVTVHCAWRSE